MTSRAIRINDAERSRREKNFKALCASLRTNNATITEIKGTNDAFPVGYGHRLGQALQGNTVVAVCELNMTSIVSDSEIDQELHPLLQLFGTSKMLRSVYLKDSSLDLTYQ
jgi:hypothetical protein